MKKLVAILTLTSACALSGNILLFDQVFTQAAGNQPSIDGTAVSNANTGLGVASTWTAGAAANGVLRTDGHVFTLAGDSAYVSLGGLVDSAKGTASGVFTLTTVMNAPSGSNWVSSGFFQSPSVTESFVGADGLASALYRTNGNLDFFAGLGTGGTAFSDIAGGGTQTLISVLDVSGWNGSSNFGTARFYTGSVTPGNLQYNYNFLSGDGVNLANIAAGISTQAGGGEGVIQSISLSQVPEPSTYVLWFGILTAAFVAYRRRKADC